jgi:hypothetical protein
MKATIAALLAMTALLAQADDLDMPNPMDRLNESSTPITDRAFPGSRVGGYGGSSEVVVPIPHSTIGPSYFSDTAIHTDKQYCVRDTFGTLTCQAH